MQRERMLAANIKLGGVERGVTNEHAERESCTKKEKTYPRERRRRCGE